MFNRRRTRPQGFHERNEFRVEAEHTRRGVIQNVSQFFGGKADVHGQQDGTDLRHSVVGFQQPMAIEAEVGNAVALLHPQTQEGGGKPVGALVELPIGEPVLAAHDADLVAKQFRRVPFEPNRCKGEQHLHLSSI